MTDTPETQEQPVIWDPADCMRAFGFNVPVSYKAKPIEYIDPAPKPFIVQIPLVEYFERVKRLKADKWQIHFCEYLQNAVVNQHIKPTFAEFHAQAQLGKTILLSQVFPAWCLGHSPMFRYVLAMYNVSRSESHADVVIQIMRSQIHREIFTSIDGHLPKHASKGGFMTNARRDVERGGMDAQMSLNPIGLESGMTGSGFEWCTIDDPYKEPKDAWSLTTYDNLQRLWEYGIKPRLAVHSCIGAMFHRYNYDDYGGFLLNTGKFDYVRYAAECDGDYEHPETGQRFHDPLDRSVGDLICPERFPLSYYTDKRTDPKVWMSMFQGRPGRDEGDFFKVGLIGTATDNDWLQCTSRARGWDHAATQGAGDNSAGSLMGFQPDETVIVSDIFSAQLDSANRVAKQKEIAEADGSDVTIVVPEGVSADGKDNVFMMRQNLQGFNVVARKVTNASPGSDAKKRRAYNLSIAVNSGKVKFQAGPWTERIKMLMRRFGNALSGDDEIDAMADTYNHLYEEFHQGLVIKGFQPQANLVRWSDFRAKFGTDKIPEKWQIYVAVKLSMDASYPNSGIIIARSAQNSGIDALFIIAEYKEYTSDAYELFNWLDRALTFYCEKNPTLIWLHKDSESYKPTIQQKIKRGIRVFKEGATAGITELNWHFLNTADRHPFYSEFLASRLYGLVEDTQFTTATNEDGLYYCRQEASTWGFIKEEPSGTGAVLDCARMITYQFRPQTTALTIEERVDILIPETVKEAFKVAKTGSERLTAALDLEFQRDIALEQLQPERWVDDLE